MTGCEKVERSERRWAVLRIAHGKAQMIGAVLSLALLLRPGMRELTAWAVAFTCDCLLASLILFRNRRRGN